MGILEIVSMSIYGLTSIYVLCGMLIGAAVLSLVYRDEQTESCQAFFRFVERWALPYTVIYMILGMLCMLTFAVNIIVKFW